MDTIMLENCYKTEQLVVAVHRSGEPVIVLDGGGDECLVAMAPSVLERILFDTALLNRTDRSSLHL